MWSFGQYGQYYVHVNHSVENRCYRELNNRFYGDIIFKCVLIYILVASFVTRQYNVTYSGRILYVSVTASTQR